jgi:hypothetical protein
MSAMPARRAKIIRFPTPAPRTPARPPQDLVELRRCRDQTEALVVRGLLQSEGLTVVLRSSLAPSVYPFSVGEQAEVVLLVSAGDLRRARAVLARRA